MTPRIIVTGGAGFIGSNLVRALNDRGETDILVVDHLNHPAKQQHLVSLQLREFQDKRVFRATLTPDLLRDTSVIFHLGACSATTEYDLDYLDANNTAYTRDLCRAARLARCRFIYASSAATYGDGSLGYSDADAVTPTLQPLNPYGWSKQRFDLQALEQGLLKEIAGLKFFNVYGPMEEHKGDMRSLVHKAYYQIADTGEMTLFRSHRPEYRDGEQQRDFLYVDDAVAVMLWLWDHPEVNGLFNCGTGQAQTWLDLAHALFAAMAREPRIRFIDIPDTIREKYQYHTQADMTKLHAAGYDVPFLPLGEGVRRYVQEHLAAAPY